MSKLNARKWILISVITLALGAAGLTVWIIQQSAAPEAAPKAPHTVPVTNEPLTSTFNATGTIEYANERDFAAALGGVLTSLPPTATVVGQGGELYRVDNQPVIMLYGSLPAWREFNTEMTAGPDVKQLEQNLADLGFFGGEADEEFTWQTEEAIKDWKEALGMERDGVIPVGRVVFSPENVRVGAGKVAIGSEVATGTVLYAASSEQVIITAKIAAKQRDSIEQGMDVTINLPNGERVAGSVASIGDPVEEQDSTGKTALVLPITVAPEKPEVLDGLAPLTAQLMFSRSSEDKVLQVPVAALLSTGDDQFAVEVYVKGEIVRVPITTGRFSSGMVEVVDGDLKSGDEVVVPE